MKSWDDGWPVFGTLAVGVGAALVGLLVGHVVALVVALVL